MDHQPFPEHLAALETDEASCTEPSADKLSFPRLRTDFGPVRQLCLVYPAGVHEPGSDYSPLAGLYKQLIRLVPMDIEVLLLVKSGQIAAELQKENFSQRIRYVVNSELKGIWLRDYAGFNMGSHLVKPTYKPKSYWGDFAVAQHISDNMKILHSLLGMDMEPVGLVWDGGNLVTNGRIAFISRQLLKDNKKGYPDEHQIEKLIQQTLGVQPVWVDLPKADPLSHTDGYLTFISLNKALVSTYPEAWARKYPKDQQCVDDLARQVRERGIDVERILEQPQDVAEASPVDSAVGIYVNMLQLNGTWLVPTYDLP